MAFDSLARIGPIRLLNNLPNDFGIHLEALVNRDVENTRKTAPFDRLHPSPVAALLATSTMISVFRTTASTAF